MEHILLSPKTVTTCHREPFWVFALATDQIVQKKPRTHEMCHQNSSSPHGGAPLPASTVLEAGTYCRRHPNQLHVDTRCKGEPWKQISGWISICHISLLPFLASNMIK